MVLEELVELQNVRVVQLLQNSNFAQQFGLLIFLQKLFIQDFDCSQRLRLLVQTLAHLTVGT